MRDLFITALFIVAVPYCLFHSEFAIALWYWASLFQPQTQTWSFAQSFPFSMIAAIVALIAYAFFKGPKLPRPTAIVVLLVLLGVWTGLTTLNAVFFDVALDEWNQFIRLLAMVLLGLIVVQTRRNLDILVWTICLSIGFYGVKIGLFALKGGLGETFHGPTYMNGNNEIARAMIMYLPFLAYLYGNFPKLWIRVGLVTAGLLSIALLILSGSRGAWLGAIAMVGFVALRSRRGFIGVAAVGLVFFLAIPLLPTRIVDRFLSIEEFKADASVQGRIGAWEYALDKFPERPLMGGGFKVFDLEHKKASHNSFFQMLGEHGAVGLSLYLSLLLATAATTVSIRRKTARRPDLKWARDLALCIQLSVVGYVVGGISINEAFFPIFYAVLGVLGSTQAIVKRELNADPLKSNAVPSDTALKWRAA